MAIKVMNKKKVIGYICQSNPFVDKKAWSGSIYKIRIGIENAGFEVKWNFHIEKISF